MPSPSFNHGVTVAQSESNGDYHVTKRPTVFRRPTDFGLEDSEIVTTHEVPAAVEQRQELHLCPTGATLPEEQDGKNFAMSSS